MVSCASGLTKGYQSNPTIINVTCRRYDDLEYAELAKVLSSSDLRATKYGLMGGHEKEVKAWLAVMICPKHIVPWGVFFIRH